MLGLIGDEEIDPDEEGENSPSTIFDALGPSQSYTNPSHDEDEDS